MLTGRVLKKLNGEYPDLTVEKIEVTKQPLQTLRAGVKMIPTLAAGGEKISGIILTSANIRQFVDKLSRS